MKRYQLHFLLLIFATTMLGCVTKPQTLPVTPRPVISADSQRGAGRTIAIEVVDARGTDVVGLRDPAASESVITTPAEMLRNIQRAVEDGYAKLGFTVVPLGEEADVALEVRLTELGYARASGGVVKNLKTGATFEVTSVMPSKTVNAVYRDGQGMDTVLRPTLSENAEILNKHIDGALAKLIADARLTTE